MCCSNKDSVTLTMTVMQGQQISASASAAAAFDAQSLSAISSTLLGASGPAVSAITLVLFSLQKRQYSSFVRATEKTI
jgi:hypothetical protein